MDHDHFRALVEFDNFVVEFEEAYRVYEEEYYLTAVVDHLKLTKAYCVWVRNYADINKKDRSPFNRMNCLISQLIKALATVPTIEFRMGIMPSDVVSNTFRRVLHRYPNEIMALTVGSNVYSLAMQRHSGEEASCSLTGLEMDIAARRIQADPDVAVDFRSLLKLRRLRGGSNRGQATSIPSP